MFLAIPVASKAVVRIDLTEEGGNVVRGTLSGSVDTTGLTHTGSVIIFTIADPPFLSANDAGMWFGDQRRFDAYSGVTGPTAFGAGGLQVGVFVSGDRFLLRAPVLYLPPGYISGTPLTSIRELLSVESPPSARHTAPHTSRACGEPASHSTGFGF